MSRDWTVRDDARDRQTVRLVLIFLLSAALVAALVTGFFLRKRSVDLGDKQAAYQAALAGEDYETAVDLYRAIREKATDTRLPQADQVRFQAALKAMDDLTDQAVAPIEAKLSQGQRLSDDDLDRLKGLSELVAGRIITHVRGLARAYLYQQTGRPVLEGAYQQLRAVDAIWQGLAALPDELTLMSRIRPRVFQINQALDQADYWAAHDNLDRLWQELEPGPFVHEELNRLQAALLAAMYEPLLDEARAFMAGGRFVSAHQELTKLQAVFPGDVALDQALMTCQPHVPEAWETLDEAVPFLTVRPLISDPQRAFDGGVYAAAAADAMLTVTEFKQLLAGLYQNGYVLVDADRLLDQQARWQPLAVPAGKKPLVLVLEGFNYYVTRRETGNAWDLVLDEDGHVLSERVDAQGKRILAADEEAIGLLDQFVSDHPDFSLDGAKGTISLTGYECVFGTVTSDRQLQERNQALAAHGYPILTLTDQELADNRQQVQALAERLKATGWLFASSTYGFVELGGAEPDRVRQDTRRWLEEVGSLLGPVNMLHYPNGSLLNSGDSRLDDLMQNGFVFFGGLGPDPYRYQGEGFVYVDKVPVNGYTLQNSQTFHLDRFFDAAAVLDRQARP